MAKKQVRNNAYYEERLQHDHPAVYADLKAGRHRTLTDALIAAGLKKTRTRLQELTNAWSKATATERAEFLRKLAGSGVALPLAPPLPLGLSFIVAVDRRLTSDATFRIREIRSRRKLKPGRMMAEMGKDPLDGSISTAMRRGFQLDPSTISALEKWLVANASI